MNSAVPPDLYLTPADKRILEVLSDGAPHSRKELHERCMGDTSNSMQVRLAFQAAVARLRKRLRPIGQDVVCRLEFRGQIFYQHVRLLNSQ